jgi:hypothetical protein
MEDNIIPIVHERIPDPYIQATDPEEIDRIMAVRTGTTRR